MVSPYLLLSLLFTVARSYSTSRHSNDMRQTPSCEQLRQLWNEVSQPREVENEIPILPFKIQNVMERILLPSSTANTRRGKPYKKMLKNNPPYFLDTTNPFLRYPVQPDVPPISPILSKQQAPLNDPLDGGFGEFHQQAADEQGIGSSKQQQATKSLDHHHHPTQSEVFDLEPLPGVPLGNKKNGENEYFIPQWGLPEEVGTFGSFVDIDLTSPYLPMMRTPKGVSSQWPEMSMEVPQTCEAVMNTDCRTTEECFCRGWDKLICLHGKCLSLPEDIGENYGTWHDRPISYSELQLLGRPQKRRFNSVLM